MQMCNCKLKECLTSSIVKIVKVLVELILKTVDLGMVLHTVVTIATDRIPNFEKRKCETASLMSILQLQFCYLS